MAKLGLVKQGQCNGMVEYGTALVAATGNGFAQTNATELAYDL